MLAYTKKDFVFRGKETRSNEEQYYIELLRQSVAKRPENQLVAKELSNKRSDHYKAIRAEKEALIKRYRPDFSTSSQRYERLNAFKSATPMVMEVLDLVGAAFFGKGLFGNKYVVEAHAGEFSDFWVVLDKESKKVSYVSEYKETRGGGKSAPITTVRHTSGTTMVRLRYKVGPVFDYISNVDYSIRTGNSITTLSNFQIYSTWQSLLCDLDRKSLMEAFLLVGDPEDVMHKG